MAGVCSELLDCSGLDLAAHLTSEAGDSGELVQGIVAACSLATQQCAQTVMMVQYVLHNSKWCRRHILMSLHSSNDWHGLF